MGPLETGGNGFPPVRGNPVFSGALPFMDYRLRLPVPARQTDGKDKPFTRLSTLMSLYVKANTGNGFRP